MILSWRNLTGEERDSAWEALEEWVWWLRSTYSEAREAVVDCWPAHEDLVQELTALYVWWEDIYEPLIDEVPDPEADKPRLDPGEEANGRSAVTWHEALHHAVQRWRLSAKCSTAECVLDRVNGDVVANWRKRRGRTRSILRSHQQTAPRQLGDAPRPTNMAG